MTLTTGQIAEKINGTLTGSPELAIRDAKSIKKAGPEEIIFLSDKKITNELNSTKAIAALVSEDLKEAVTLEAYPNLQCIIYAPHAQNAVIEILQLLRPRMPLELQGISDQARIHESVKIGAHPEIHPGVKIEADVQIGDRCKIYPGVHISPGCVLGDDVTLYPNVVLYDSVLIGNRVAIHACSVIGADGFGYRLVNGRHERIPHFGSVRIEDDVEIGSCTTVDRGMIDDTVVGEGTKLDNLVMVAHNCELGKHNIMVSQVGLAGSVTSGDYVVCAGHVGIADHVHLGSQSVLGSKSGVHRDVPDGQTQLGCPAEPIDRAMKVFMAQRKLPEMRQDVKELLKQVKELTERLDKLTNPPNEEDITSAA